MSSEALEDSPSVSVGESFGVMLLQNQNREEAILCVEMAKLAYSRTDEVMAAAKTKKWKQICSDPSKPLRFVTMVSSEETFERVYISFRGTEDPNSNFETSMRNWFTNANAKLQPLKHSTLVGRVHTGFQAAVRKIMPEVLKALEDLDVIQLGQKSIQEKMQRIETCKPLHLVFVGHSLGGAIATLASVLLSVLLSQEAKLNLLSLKVVTFGAPLVGDADFAELYGKFVGIRSTARFVNTLDLVPYLPVRDDLRSAKGVKEILKMLGWECSNFCEYADVCESVVLDVFIGQRCSSLVQLCGQLASLSAEALIEPHKMRSYESHLKDCYLSKHAIVVQKVFKHGSKHVGSFISPLVQGEANPSALKSVGSFAPAISSILQSSLMFECGTWAMMFMLSKKHGQQLGKVSDRLDSIQQDLKEHNRFVEDCLTKMVDEMDKKQARDLRAVHRLVKEKLEVQDRVEESLLDRLREVTNVILERAFEQTSMKSDTLKQRLTSLQLVQMGYSTEYMVRYLQDDLRLPQRIQQMQEAVFPLLEIVGKIVYQSDHAESLLPHAESLLPQVNFAFSKASSPSHVICSLKYDGKPRIRLLSPTGCGQEHKEIHLLLEPWGEFHLNQRPLMTNIEQNRIPDTPRFGFACCHRRNYSQPRSQPPVSQASRTPISMSPPYSVVSLCADHHAEDGSIIVLACSDFRIRIFTAENNAVPTNESSSFSIQGVVCMLSVDVGTGLLALGVAMRAANLSGEFPPKAKVGAFVTILSQHHSSVWGFKGVLEQECVDSQKWRVKVNETVLFLSENAFDVICSKDGYTPSCLQVWKIQNEPKMIHRKPMQDSLVALALDCNDRQWASAWTVRNGQRHGHCIFLDTEARHDVGVRQADRQPLCFQNQVVSMVFASPWFVTGTGGGHCWLWKMEGVELVCMLRMLWSHDMPVVVEEVALGIHKDEDGYRLTLAAATDVGACVQRLITKQDSVQIVSGSWQPRHLLPGTPQLRNAVMDPDQKSLWFITAGKQSRSGQGCRYPMCDHGALSIKEGRLVINLTTGGLPVEDAWCFAVEEEEKDKW